MSESPEQQTRTDEQSSQTADSGAPEAIGDEQLPHDLRPGDDNPLAEPLDLDDEATKSREELGMHHTQADTTGTYESSGATPSTESTEQQDGKQEDGQQEDGKQEDGAAE